MAAALNKPEYHVVITVVWQSTMTGLENLGPIDKEVHGRKQVSHNLLLSWGCGMVLPWCPVAMVSSLVDVNLICLLTNHMLKHCYS